MPVFLCVREPKIRVGPLPENGQSVAWSASDIPALCATLAHATAHGQCNPAAGTNCIRDACIGAAARSRGIRLRLPPQLRVRPRHDLGLDEALELRHVGAQGWQLLDGAQCCEHPANELVMLVHLRARDARSGAGAGQVPYRIATATKCNTTERPCIDVKPACTSAQGAALCAASTRAATDGRRLCHRTQRIPARPGQVARRREHSSVDSRSAHVLRQRVLFWPRAGVL